jgi:carboxymethylenebutenolidase
MNSLSNNEPVRERLASIRTTDGPMPTFVAQPHAEGQYPAVVVIQHIGGLSETMKIVARRVAQLGFLCVVPALYHRLGEIVVDPVSVDPAVSAIRSIAVAHMSPSRLDMDIRATLKWLRDDASSRPSPCGIIGFGGGAAHALRIAADFRTDFHALACILGVGFVRNGDAASPHTRLGDLAGGAYFGFAENDEIILKSSVDDLCTALATSHAAYDVVVHPGVRHGYLFSDRAAYDEAAAEEDWTRIKSLFSRYLS